MTPSGPAAATRPFREAMLRMEAVAEGSELQAEVRRTLASDAIERKPRDYETKTRVLALTVPLRRGERGGIMSAITDDALTSV